MATPKVYIDTCCLIEALKIRLGAESARPGEADMVQRILRAARDGKVDLYTSMLTVSEILYINVDERPPSENVRAQIDRLLFSGRDGIRLVSSTPEIARLSRKLAWDHGVYGRSIDQMHLASAISVKAEEFLTFDGRLKAKLKRTEIMGCRLIAASDSQCLPTEYRNNDLFKEPKADANREV